MSQYYMLLKNGMVDFDKLLIDKYSLIGLDETEAIFLIKLKKIFDNNTKISETIIIKELVNTMAINEKQIIELLVKLINSQYISLKIVDNKETYSLDDTYKRLSSLLDEDSYNEEKKEKESELKKTVAFIEKECEKLISSTELEVIKHWIDVDKFTFSQIKEATLECLKLKKKSIKNIDMMLSKFKKDSQVKKTQTKENLQDLFNSVYGKIK